MQRGSFTIQRYRVGHPDRIKRPFQESNLNSTTATAFV